MDLHELQGISALTPRASLPRSSVILVSAELFFSYISTPLSAHSGAGFSSLLNSVIPEVLLLSLMGSALASSGSAWKPAGIGPVGHRGSFWHLLREVTLIATPCHCHALATQIQK